MDKNNSSKAYDINDRLLDFSVNIIKIIERLPNSRAGNHIAGQLVRSGTAPAANYGEAQSAESRRDFIHKMKLSLKELRETFVWLNIIQRRSLFKNENIIESILTECNELISIFVVSIKTAEKNNRNSKQGKAIS